MVRSSNNKQPRVRGYCFTLNNPTNEDIERIKSITTYSYLILGYEKGSERNTPHIQGYIHYKSSTRFSTVKKDLQRAHVEARRGSVTQAIDYCKKDGVFQEFGSLPVTPGEAGKMSWDVILQKAKDGEVQWIQEQYPKVWVTLSHRLEGLRERKTTILTGELEHEWWVGPTGSGKSQTLWRYYGKHFQKELNKWWCGYADEEVVAIEEWSPKNECTGSQLKIWADRYPFTAQIKGGSIKKVRPLKIIVLSNYDLDVCFQDARDLEPLRRRFKQIRFPDDIEIAIDRAVHFAQHRVPTYAEDEDAAPKVVEVAEEEVVPNFQDSEVSAVPPQFVGCCDELDVVDEHDILGFLDL